MGQSTPIDYDVVSYEDLIEELEAAVEELQELVSALRIEGDSEADIEH